MSNIKANIEKSQKCLNQSNNTWSLSNTWNNTNNCMNKNLILFIVLYLIILFEFHIVVH